MLARKTGEVRYVKRGPRVLPYPAGIYSENVRYTSSVNIAPYVLFQPDPSKDGTRYVMNKVGSWLGTEQGMTPAEDYALNGQDATWIPFEHFNAVEIELALIRFGQIGSAVFYDDYMFSQYGQDKSGNEVYSYKNFNPKDPMDPDNAFRPNILVNWRKGEAYFRKAIFYECSSVGQGVVNLTNAPLTYFEVNSNFIALNSNNMRMVCLYLPYDNTNCNPNWDTKNLTVMNISQYPIIVQFGQYAPLTVNNKKTNLAGITLAPSTFAELVFVVDRGVCGIVSGAPGGLACQAGKFYLRNPQDFVMTVSKDDVGGYSSSLVSKTNTGTELE